LTVELHGVIQTALDKKVQVKSSPVTLMMDGVPRQVVMHLGPASGDSDEDGYLLIVFDESDPPPSDAGEIDSARAEEFRSELHLARQRLHSMAEEYASAREEMRSSNEELQSANEELRSTMEELETSKEELQSINEELVTLNQENRHKVEELSLMSSDLQNLIVATDIPTLFVDRGLRILRFTPRLSDVFNVRNTDCPI
jgi:two-component system CheB/CheR fusion protein